MESSGKLRGLDHNKQAWEARRITEGVSVTNLITKKGTPNFKSVNRNAIYIFTNNVHTVFDLISEQSAQQFFWPEKKNNNTKIKKYIFIIII